MCLDHFLVRSLKNRRILAAGSKLKLEEILVGTISLLVGCLLVVFRVSFAHKLIEQQNKFWGFHFAEGAIKATEFISLIVGAGFIILALLSIFQTIRFK